MSTLETTARAAARARLLRATTATTTQTPAKTRFVHKCSHQYVGKFVGHKKVTKKSFVLAEDEVRLLKKVRLLAANLGGIEQVAIEGQLFVLGLMPLEDAAPGDDLDEAAAALERELLAKGRLSQREILGSDEMLTLDEASNVSGIPVRTLSQMRADGRLLALARPGALKGFRFPRWQFDARVLPVMPDILAAFGQSRTWQVRDFLTHREPLLAGRVPLDEIRSGHEDAVLRILKHAAEMEHGSY